MLDKTIMFQLKCYQHNAMDCIETNNDNKSCSWFKLTNVNYNKDHTIKHYTYNRKYKIEKIENEQLFRGKFSQIVKLPRVDNAP